ncbi:uncharacterized protein LOC117889843 [Drosophila subobscura]|uniref:uncharacterized protein LOC117889843 n=1 Tax=Drosophila subobscura TaxID=7241 RepID=UPI00155A97B5|nr:uncharacterized protein LOC117889843 [Drosophila subobscura]
MDFIDDFIEEYKVNPCLWKADSVDFRNRSKRQEAYMKLIEVATKHGEMYNVERTKQKINNLRCAFRHQLRKCNEIKKKGEKFEPYCPKRRYFESLMFLKDEEIPDKKAKRHDNHPPLQQQYSESAVTLIPAENCEELSDAESLTKPHKADNQKLSPKNCPTEYLFEDASAACAPDPIISIQTVNANNNNNNNHHGSGATIKEVEIVMTAADSRVISERRKSLPDIPKQIGNDSEQVRPVVAASQQKHNQNQNKINRKRSSSLSSQQSEDNEAVPAAKFRADISTIDFERLFSLALKSADHQLDDHFSSFGKIIAHKLRSMDATQAIYAEKIIADVLYQGQLKMLSTLSTHQFAGVDNATVYVDSHSK